tara:strand:- start:252 stop:788 length:537 start_codon:yes stop_codon:yes gene_type:complete
MLFQKIIALAFLLTGSILIPLAINAAEISSWSELVRKGNKYFKKSDSLPFTGVLKNFNESGSVSLRGSFKDGFQHGDFLTFHENGTISLKGQFKLGKQNGLWTEFYDDGSIHWKLKYFDGMKADGLFLMFHKNGKMKSKVTYKNNLPATNWIYYNEEGKEERIDIYENGKFFYEKHLN